MNNKQVLLLYLFAVVMCCSCNMRNEQKEKVIGIQPLGEVKKEYIDSVQAEIIRSYNFKVIKLPALPMQKSFFVNIKSPRYRADSIIHFFKKNKPDSIDIVLAITEKDISVTNRAWDGSIQKPEAKYTDWGVFGLGFMPGPSCVVSTYRINGNNPGQTLKRLKKIALHEVGHNLGLPHCEMSKCVMQDAAEKISTVDQVNAALCHKCRRKI